MFLLAIVKLESNVNHEEVTRLCQRLHKENVLVDTLDCSVELQYCPLV